MCCGPASKTPLSRAGSISILFAILATVAELALYRKYRPEKFAEVIGQAPVVAVLERAASSGTPAHAYLFAGPRGTGKTSLARILAKALGTAAHDLYELDAASSRGIDEIRELREAVRTLPFDSRYKVYIIDEVHMLTREAFNALLKTLEEPPEHVIFILATTEAHKLPETVISRCQSFTFKKPSTRELEQAVARIVKSEGWQIDKPSLELIALLGDGSFRDAIGLLQKAMTASGAVPPNGASKKIEIKELEKITGAPSTELVGKLVEALLDKNTAAALGVINQASKEEREMKVFLTLILRLVRLVMLLVYAPSDGPRVKEGVSVEEWALLERLRQHPEAKQLPSILRELLASYDEIGCAVVPELPLELVVIKICS